MRWIKNLLNNKYVKMALTMMAALCGAVLFYMALSAVPDILSFLGRFMNSLMPVFAGFVISYLLYPVCSKTENFIISILKRVKLNKTQKIARIISVTLTISGFILTVYILSMLIIPQVTRSIYDLNDSLPQYIGNFRNWVKNLPAKGPLLAALAGPLEEISEFDTSRELPFVGLLKTEDILKLLSEHAINAARFIWNFAIGLAVSAYILGSREKFAMRSKQVCSALWGEEGLKTATSAVLYLHKTFGGFITGKIADSIIIGLLCFVACMCLSIPYPVLVSVIVGLTNVIPFVGPFMGAIPCGILILLAEPEKCLRFAIMIIILQQLDGNVIGPKILGGATGLPAFWVIVIVTAAGGLFGVPGMFFGVPVFAVIYGCFMKYCDKKQEMREIKKKKEEKQKKPEEPEEPELCV